MNRDKLTPAQHAGEMTVSLETPAAISAWEALLDLAEKGSRP